MKLKKFLFSIAWSLLAPGLAIAQDTRKTNASQQRNWQFSVSAGTLIAPAYLGADDYQVSAFPNISVQYRDLFFASLDGAGFNLLNRNGLRAGPIAKYNFGRDEDGSNPLGIGGDSNDLKGLGDVDGTVELGGFAEYAFRQFSVRIEVRHGLGGHEGLVGEAELKYNNSLDALGRPIHYSLGPKVTFADENYNSAFFDVNASQSAASGLSQFDAGAGINSVGLHGSLTVPVTQNISVIGFGGVDRLTGDIADSSLVQERGSETQGLFGMMLNYRF